MGLLQGKGNWEIKKKWLGEIKIPDLTLVKQDSSVSETDGKRMLFVGKLKEEVDETRGQG